MLHERLSFQVMRQLGIPTQRAAHTRLYVNDEYIGLYMIEETIDKTFLKSHFSDNEGYLYKYEHGSVENYYLFTYPGPDPDLYCPQPFQPETHESDPKCGQLEAMIRTMNQAPDVAEDEWAALPARGTAAKPYSTATVAAPGVESLIKISEYTSPA